MSDHPSNENQSSLVANIIQDSRFREDHVKQINGTDNRMRSVVFRVSKCAKSEADKIMGKLSNGHKGKITYSLWAEEGEKKKKATLSDEQSMVIKLQVATLELCQPPARDARKTFEKRLIESAKQLPVWPWVDSVDGVGPLSLALIIGSTGDLSNYSSESKVWKRMGLAVINGERQRKCKDKAKALEHGYNPRRRAIMWNVGECLIKANKKGKYKKFYDERKAKKMAEGLTRGHAHNDARRIIAKEFLKDLRVAWNHHRSEPQEAVVPAHKELVEVS